MRPLLALGLCFALGCGATQSSHVRESGSTTGGAAGTTTSGVGVAPLCTDCSADDQCASGFCDLFDTQGHGFCDVAQACESDDACEGYASCNAAFGNCECPQLGGTTSSSAGATASSGTGTGSTGTTASGATTSGTTASSTTTSGTTAISTTTSGTTTSSTTTSGTTASSTTTSSTTTSGTTSGGSVCTSCTSTSQCGTGHCLKESGGTNYYCGADCTADASVCPSGWTCDSLSSGKSGCRSVAPTCP